MSRTQGRECSCRKHMVDSMQAAQACSATCHQKAITQRYAAPGSSTRHLTPPPSQPGSPRRSLETIGTRSPTFNESQRRSVVPALNRAFSSSDEDDDVQDSDSATVSSLFPTNVYRNRVGSKRASTQSPARDMQRSAAATSRNPTPPREPQDCRSQSRSMTPEVRSPAAAPMSAAFARLSHKDASDRTQRGRALVTSDLGAKMFEGAA